MFFNRELVFGSRIFATITKRFNAMVIVPIDFPAILTGGMKVSCGHD